MNTAVWLGNRATLRKLGLCVLAFVAAFGLPMAGRAATPASVTLKPSVTSPQKLGTPVTWTATVQNASSGHTYGYQFSVTYNGQTQILSDFSPTPTFTWVPHTVEGAYDFNVVVRDITTTPFTLFAPVSVGFQLLPWVTAPLAAGVINPTSHPLVALFSAPPCAATHQLLVRFQPASPTGSQSPHSMTTNLVPCSTNSANFYIAGMYPSSKYLMHWEEYAGITLVNTGSNLSFTTGPLPSTLASQTYKVNVPAQAYDSSYPVAFFQSVLGGGTATDLAGNLIWYAANTSFILRMEPGGLYYSYTNGSNFYEYDLAGNVVIQSNTEIINEQLTAKGYPVITTFNSHEARNLPDGNIALLGYRYIVSTSAQGGTPAKPVNILGDEIVVVDRNMQLVWAWDAFAHQDINRAATDGDVCLPNAGGCPAGAGGNDWLHSNAIQGTADGNLILSERAQDWFLKINYAKGKGDGTVIWRMGPGGDFTTLNPPSATCFDPTYPGGSTNLIPWFTHQHDPSFQFEDQASGDGDTLLTVYDDGNTRHGNCSGTQNSRGMVLLVNEAARPFTSRRWPTWEGTLWPWGPRSC
jgi:arylsulfate sulfotransferase